MSAKDLGRLLQLCQDALERPSAEREGFLDEACAGNPELRHAVEELLAEQTAASGYLETPAWSPDKARLTAGTRLGPYEIKTLLGAGGMGEVYRARDTRLKRDVALKIIHPRFAADADQLRRFEQEARAASRIADPNILVVYDIGVHEGSPFIVSELLEGESLREKLGGPLLPQRAVEYAVQVARGLAAAHVKGIVHRDLKPENLFVTPDGRVKILDFGIAKLTRPEAPSDAITDVSLSAPPTESGVILGTVGYMSPEQVLGKPLDARSDLFSLGVVMYEMLAGKRAFRKETAPETMAAILREDPPDLSTTNTQVPPGLERIVRHCLEKDPGSRFQSARDVVFALESLSQPTTSATLPIPKGRRTRRAAITALGLCLLAGSYAGLFVWTRDAFKPPDLSFQRLTFRRGWVNAARFAPDGQTVVYSAEWEGGPNEVFSMRLDSPESRPMGYSPAELLALSSASDLALSLNSREDRNFFNWTGTLARVPFSGGTPRPTEERIAFADWSPDGKEMALVRETDKGSQLEYPAGQVVYAPGGGSMIAWPRVSPTGDLVAFGQWGDAGGGVLAVVDKGGKKRILAEGFYWGVKGLAWSPKGDEVWFTAARTGNRQDVLAVTLSGRQRLLLKEPVSMRLLDVGRDGRILVAQDQSISRCFFLGKPDSSDRELNWLDASGIQGISRDGRRVILNEAGLGAGTDRVHAYLRGTDGSPPMKLGPGQAWGFSPDERSVVANSFSSIGIIVYPVGPGQPRTIPLKEFSYVDAPFLLPDGQTLVFMGAKASRGSGIWLTDLSGTTPRPVTPEGVRPQLPLYVTPDGRFVLGVSEGGGQTLMYPLAGGGSQPFKGLHHGEQLAGWAADGRSYFATNTNSLPLIFYQVDWKTGERRVIRNITPTDRGGRLGAVYGYVTPDGKNYAYNVGAALSELHLITGLK